MGFLRGIYMLTQAPADHNQFGAHVPSSFTGFFHWLRQLRTLIVLNRQFNEIRSKSQLPSAMLVFGLQGFIGAIIILSKFFLCALPY